MQKNTVQLKITKKRMNIANFINIYIYIQIYIYIYIPILYVIRMTQNENDSINSILQNGPAVDNNCCVVFPPSRFPYLIVCPR